MRAARLPNRPLRPTNATRARGSCREGAVCARTSMPPPCGTLEGSRRRSLLNGQTLCGRRMMRIAGENGWLEIAPGDDRETFDVRASVGDFSGRNPRVGIGADVQRRFLQDLAGVERLRRGEARLQSMSPDEL